MKQKKIPSAMKILDDRSEVEKKVSEQSEISDYHSSVSTSYQHRPYNLPTDHSSL